MVKRSMATIQIREFPDELYNALKEEAKQHRRSLTQQAIIAIEKGLDYAQQNKERRKQLFENLTSGSPEVNRVTDSDIVSWVREGRDR
jgi:hypothetical protein